MKKFNFLFFLLIFGFGAANAQYTENSDTAYYVEEATEEYSDEYYDEEETILATPPRAERGPVYYEQRNLDPSFKDNCKGDKYNYDKVVKEKPPKKLEKSEPLINIPPGIFQIIMYTLLGVIVIVILYLIFKNAGGFAFGEERNKIKYDTSEEQELEDTDDIANNNFPQLIQKAKSEKDFRRAVRYYYLWVLQKLADKKLIQFNKDKTDYDYFLELGQHSIKDDFSHNTYIYDYVWYGKFELNAHEFELAESIFQRTLNKLR